MITPAEQRFRKLFLALDAENEWNNFLTATQLHYARRAAEAPETWMKLLSGVPCLKSTDDMTDESDSSLSGDDVWMLSAIIRKRVSFAAIDEDFFRTSDGRQDDDDGLMSGDDGGYTDYGQLKREEKLLRKEKTGVFRLYGYQGDDVSKMPKPLFGGRVREMLMKINQLCEGDTMKAMTELVETEAREGYDTVEDCFAAVEALISEHRAPLGESCGMVENMMTELRSEYDEFLTWFEDSCMKNRAMGGVIGITVQTKSSNGNPSGRIPYDEEGMNFRSDGAAPGVSIAKRPRVPIFGNAVRTKGNGKSLWELLGPTNSVVKNLGLYERVIKLKKEMCRLQDLKDGKIVKEEAVEIETQKPRCEVIEIGEELPEDARTRPRAMGEAFVALLLSHTGFTHADCRALDIVTDVFEDYVRGIGRSLICCRENIDNNSASVAETAGKVRRKNRNELLMELEMVMDCVRGGFPELYNYVRADMMRTEQALREVEIRLKERVKGLGGGVEQITEEEEEIDGSDFVSEDDVVLDGEGLPFGYLGKRVWFDCLGGLRVPESLVFGL